MGQDRNVIGIPGQILWEERSSGIHGRGLYARVAIPRGTRIIEYVGERITKAEAERRALAQMERARAGGDGAVYIFTLNKRYDIDGKVDWNPARWINHSCQPNCEPQIVRGHIWIVARRRIAPGEELTYDYGYDVEHYAEHPCRCGAPCCVGAIVSRRQWRKLARLRAAAAAAAAEAEAGASGAGGVVNAQAGGKGGGRAKKDKQERRIS